MTVFTIPKNIVYAETSKFDQIYFQKNLLHVKIIRDEILFKTFTSTPNPYDEDLKTIREYARIIEHNTIKTTPLIFDDIKTKQEEIAKKTLFRILGFKEITNPDIYLTKNIQKKSIENIVQKTDQNIKRSDNEFKSYKIKEIESAEILRDMIFEIYYTSTNPYLEYGVCPKTTL